MVSTEKKGYRTWSKEIVTPDNITKSLRVEEIENGYLLTMRKYGQIDNIDDKEYLDECKRIYSETNPFESDEKSKEEKNLETMKVFTDDLFDLT